MNTEELEELVASKSKGIVEVRTLLLSLASFLRRESFQKFCVMTPAGEALLNEYKTWKTRVGERGTQFGFAWAVLGTTFSEPGDLSTSGPMAMP